MGYTVTIGPGRADGGTDVTAIRTSNVIGPELVMIQCKRYGQNTPIKITDVQAFWTVANDENATRAFFVTTTSVYRSVGGVSDFEGEVSPELVPVLVKVCGSECGDGKRPCSVQCIPGPFSRILQPVGCRSIPSCPFQSGTLWIGSGDSPSAVCVARHSQSARPVTGGLCRAD